MNERELLPTALIYDFDGTLAPGDAPNRLVRKLGKDPKEFWPGVKETTVRIDGDENAVYMRELVELARMVGKPVTEKLLRQIGKGVTYYDGVIDWFVRINRFGMDLGLKIEHYVISSGIGEIIDGCSIAGNFERVFASRYIYDKDGYACWPALCVNYTNKTQFLFRINKDIQNTWDNMSVNKWIPMHERRIPFERMIFFGDGETDIPTMKMVRHQQGYAIAVFGEESWKMNHLDNKVHRLISEDRVTYACQADYTEASVLDMTVKGVLGRMAREFGSWEPTS